MYIKVSVKTGMRKESLLKKSEDSFLVSVKEKAERNMANIRVLELIAMYFEIPKNKVRIIKGHKHPSKIFSISSV